LKRYLTSHFHLGTKLTARPTGNTQPDDRHANITILCKSGVTDPEHNGSFEKKR